VEPSKAELIRLLTTARDAVLESQKHWGAVLHLTGDRRSQRRQREAVALLEAMLRDVETMPERGASVSRWPTVSDR
jgi:hypothetical protein